MDSAGEMAPAEGKATAKAPGMGPEQVRQMRGALSRAAFARHVGVTPHSVYRWELPDAAPEARRPRGKELLRLQQLARGASPEPSPAALPLAVAAVAVATRLVAAEDVSLVLPALERLFTADLRRAHTDLVQLTLRSQDLSADARALARFGIAVAELLARSDPRAALLAITPALADAEASLLARGVEGRVFAAAAMMHALPDASIFDLGRVHAYSARVEALASLADPEARSLSCLALLCAATVVGDRELLDRAYMRLDEVGWNNLPPLLDLHVSEFEALRPELSGKTGASLRSLELIAERAEQLGYHLLHSRVLGHLALRMLENLSEPDRVIEVARRARQIGKGSRIGPGIHLVFCVRAEVEALLRLGRTAEAFAELGELDAWSAETGIVPVTAVPVQARLLLLTGRHAELTLLTQKLRECDVSALKPICQAYAAATEAVACIASSDDPLASVAAFEHAESEAARWPLLRRFVLMHRVLAHIIAGQDGAAHLALRRAERFVDVFPSAWVSAHLRRLEGTLLAARGQWSEGRQLLESAVATFDLAHDLCDAALVRHLMATFAAVFGDGDPSAAEGTRRALGELGVVPPRSLEVGIAHLHVRRTSDTESHDRLRVEDLLVPVRRLAARGVAPPLILRELLSIVRGLFPDRSVQLEELDSGGNARPLIGATVAEAGYEWVEFGTGSGRLLRVGVRGELGDHERSALTLLAMTTSLALEAATLRGISDPFEASAVEDKAPDIPGFIAASPEMRKLRAELVRLGSSRATVIITGESGSGKEVVARAIHALSERSAKSYVPFNCSTVPRDLFEGQLFGYRRGAFTGANSDHPGVLRGADGGTIFLDEIAELPLDVQPKLLRFLENSEVFPLGERKPIRVDVRVLAATHRDLLELVRQGRFREDLYYRLQVVPIHVPPLRSRPEDVAVLARYFVRELSAGNEPPVIAPDAIAALMGHPWRGNVRELRNVIERALAFSPAPDVLQAKHLRLSS